MALLEWSDELSVGVKLIDKQHMILIRTINLLAMAVQRQSSKDLLKEILETLADYTDTHFAYEEELFDRFGYPESAEHKRLHRALLEKVVAFKTRWENGDEELGPELLKFLVEWLRGHILGCDKKYSSFLIKALGTA